LIRFLSSHSCEWFILLISLLGKEPSAENKIEFQSHQSFIEEIYCFEIMLQLHVQRCSVCICILPWMDFYAIYGIAPYTEPPVIPVTDVPYVRATVTTSTMYMTTTAMLLTTILKTPTVASTVKTTSTVTTLPTTSSITTIVTTSQMTTFRNDRVKIENVISRKVPVTTRKENFPVTVTESVTKIPYYIPRIVTPRYSTLKEPQVIYSWTRTTSPAPIVSTRASTYRYFIKGVKNLVQGKNHGYKIVAFNC
jgi:hypothetical protein